jgi:uncharacterized protein YoxC
MNKLTVEQIERLDELESVLKAFLYDIDYIKENGENEYRDVNSLFDDVFDRIRELNLFC